MPGSTTSSHAHQVLDLHDALLQASHAKNSIYESTRMSGENRHRHHVLPTDAAAEKFDHCSDTLDSLYASSLASLVATSKSSRL